MVDRPKVRRDLFRTIQTSITAGSISPTGTIEKFGELESRSLKLNKKTNA
jgi:hypothetical protein